MSLATSAKPMSRPASRVLALAPAFLAQAALLGGLVALYFWARLEASGQLAAAIDNAHRLYAWEREAGLPDELALQQWLLARPGLARVANTYYATVHFPLTGLVLLWLYARHRPEFRWMRNVLIGLTAAGLALTFSDPLAPPRLMPELGFTDVAAALGPSVYSHPGSASATNQLAAMPSLHVGWAFLVALAILRATRSRWRWLWLLHPVVTWYVVVATANHYWADGLVALALLGTVIAALRALRPVTRRQTSRTLPGTINC